MIIFIKYLILNLILKCGVIKLGDLMKYPNSNYYTLNRPKKKSRIK